MNTSAHSISYKQTNVFSKLVSDYVDNNPALQPFYNFNVSIEGIKAAINQRKKYPTNRQLLTEVLKKQYANFSLTQKQQLNIDALSNENCFTITTAHQPNIFTGPLYFIYKILHVIKLSEYLKQQITENVFVPVYYMGSEDADFDELGHFYIDGEKYQWQTNQTGAFGRMKVDNDLIKLINNISGQILIHPFGNTIISLMKDCYKEGETIEQATLKLVNQLFKDYGLLIVLPDNAKLKNTFASIIKNELVEKFSHKMVEETATAFPKEYKVQASGRDINLFYLLDDKRERIEKIKNDFNILNTDIKFNEDSISNELINHPERFSPNVILRPVFQEIILPNIAFIGGGGEIAYWLELKKVFEKGLVPFPVLVLRNSFLIIEEKYHQTIKKLNISLNDLFKTEQDLLNNIVEKETNAQLSLFKEKELIKSGYEQIKKASGNIDITLANHSDALQTKALKKIEALEKKMLKAEKKKFEAQKKQIQKLKSNLFPHHNLQERVENFIPFYAKWGNTFIKMLYDNSLSLEQEFVIIEEKIL